MVSIMVRQDDSSSPQPDLKLEPDDCLRPAGAQDLNSAHPSFRIQCPPESFASVVARDIATMLDKTFGTHQRKGRSLDNPVNREGDRSPIHGTFVSVSPSRARSLSPHKRLPRQSVHINMDLTEYQMDRLADVFSSHSNVNCKSPIGLQGDQDASKNTLHECNKNPEQYGLSSQGMSSFPKSIPHVPHRNRPKHQGNDELRSSPCQKRGGDKRCSTSTTFSDLMPPFSDKIGRPSGTIAERRCQNTPNRIAVDEARKYGTFVHRAPTVPAACHPLKAHPVFAPIDDSWSSVYSQEEHRADPRVRPLSVEKSAVSRRIDDVLQTYHDWDPMEISSPELLSPEPLNLKSPTRNRSPHPERRCAESSRQAPQLVTRAEQPKQVTGEVDSYSPLVTYFAFEGLPVQKIGGKTLIGEQGWLKRPNPNQTPEHKKKNGSPKKTGLLDSIKKMAKGMTESKNVRRPREVEKDANPPKADKLAISLDPREQSLLYCELEFQVSNAIHAYITNELGHGRLDTDKLKVIANGWKGKGRPRVVGFRYDLETQLELINLHLTDFRFFGRRQGNPLEIAGLLHAMKVNARAMRIRTFCQPDSVIAKQLVDSQSLFNTIGCSDVQQVALAEIAQFFKVIVERERSYRNQLTRPGVTEQQGMFHEYRKQHHWDSSGNEGVNDIDQAGTMNGEDANRDDGGGSPLEFRGSH
ncbi:hypothetical protein D7B24_007665 [Verticillium nonalfalfae]|uniref:Uncharacterized protein n=1 Tax=Verticillium nonalfalfae TaxID=1051616 RepID=A0A3M9Y824_9PEZI|nr:uncharacterized protein D7B24_007665 [Verticillium nonalfalfae]RNJ56182.1 hypothetical protein D7B24_007665 [Verticillium nonalfalfae]